MKLIITLKKAGNCWLAKFSDDVIPEFIPCPFSAKAPVERVIAVLSEHPRNRNAEFIIVS